MNKQLIVNDYMMLAWKMQVFLDIHMNEMQQAYDRTTDKRLLTNVTDRQDKINHETYSIFQKKYGTIENIVDSRHEKLTKQEVRMYNRLEKISDENITELIKLTNKINKHETIYDA